MELRDYTSYDALGLVGLIEAGEVSPQEVASAAVEASDLVNPHINAVAEIWTDESVLSVSELDANAAFYGVPFLIKDLAITRAGRLNELGSRLAAGVRATEDSTLMSKFRKSGLVTIGRTTTPEFAISTTTEGAATGPTRNPWDIRRSAGGSSGGSGAAVAAGIVPVAHATDGGGSIRVPASANGLFGIKPSRGRVSNGPAVDEVWSGLAVQLGVSRTVRDSAALLDAAQGGAVGEPYYIASPESSFLSASLVDPRSLRIGIMRDPLNGTKTDPAVADQIELTARLCEYLGHEVTRTELDLGVSWEAFVFANAQFWTVNTAAWIDAIAQFTGRPLGADILEPSTHAVYEYGRNVTGLNLLNALDVRNSVTRAIGAFFEKHDILLTPAIPRLPPLIGEYNDSQEQLDGLEWVNHVFSHSPFTAIANVAGVPAMSVPLYEDPCSGMPVGSQFFAGFGQEALLFSLAGQLERSQPWSARKPKIWAGSPSVG